MRNKFRYFFMFFLLAIIMTGCKSGIYDRTSCNEKLTRDEEYQIYTDLCYQAFLIENKDRLDEVGLNPNQDLKTQIYEEKNESFYDFFKKAGIEYKRRVDSLKSSNVKADKKDMDRFISTYAKVKNIKDEEKKFKEENKIIKNKFKIDEKKVFTVVNRISSSNKSLEKQKEKYKPTNQEIYDYIKEHEKELTIHKLKILTYDNEDTANKLKEEFKRGKNYNKEKGIRNLSGFLNELDPKIKEFIENEHPKKGDMFVYKNRNLFNLVVYSGVEKLTNFNQKSKVEVYYYSDKKEAKKLFNKYNSAAFPSKYSIRKKSLLKKHNYTVDYNHFKNDDINKWIYARERKEGDVELFKEKNIGVIVFFKEKIMKPEFKAKVLDEVKKENIIN